MKHLLIVAALIFFQQSVFSQKTSTPYDKALQKIEQENYEGAITDLNRIIQADSSNATAIFKRGYCYALLRDHKAALIDFNRAIFMNAGEGEWFSERGIAKLNLRDMEGACQDWKTASKMGFSAVNDLIDEYCP